MSDDKPQGPVAPADSREKEKGHEGVHPIETHPSQPSFPAPIGVDPKDLEKAGVAHGYTLEAPEPNEGPAFEDAKPSKKKDESKAPEPVKPQGQP